MVSVLEVVVMVVRTGVVAAVVALALLGVISGRTRAASCRCCLA